MILSDWSTCPKCKMCANYTDFKKLLEVDAFCPMCEQHVPPMDLKISNDP